MLVPEEGLEPSHLAAHDFESCASAIPPLRQFNNKPYTTQKTLKLQLLLIERIKISSLRARKFRNSS